MSVLINSIGAFDPSIRGLEVSNCIYRINRDIRFSIDKSIYKTHFGAFIVKGGKKMVTSMQVITFILNLVTIAL